MLAGPATTTAAAWQLYIGRRWPRRASPEPRLIHFGDKAQSGARMLARSGRRRTAVFAANNAIAMGVIAEAGRRCTHPPRPGLVCFDDLPDAPRGFPF